MASTSQLVSQEGYKQITYVCRMCETESTCTYIFNEPIVCVECGKRIKNLENFTDGIIVNNKKHYVCKICIKFFVSVSKLREHWRRFHALSKILYTCIKCGKSFIYKENLQKHIKNHNKKWYQCPKCPRRFTQVRLLQKHKKYHFKLRTHICNTCGQTFANATSLKLHSLVHVDYEKRKCQCKVCFKYFSNKKGAQMHMKYTHSNDKPYKCVCGKTYKHNKNLKSHIETYKKKYPHSVCGKWPSLQSGFYVDEGHCSSVRLYKCDTCKQTFKRKDSIRRHVMLYLRCEKSYKCHVCGKLFLKKYYLTQHENVHSVLRPYECDTCKKTFKSKSSIKQHVILHLPREKRYQCHICGKRFLRTHNLNTHEKIHSSLRLYECDICKKTFKRKDTLKRHVEIHFFRKTSYVCSVCDKSYLSNQAFDRHIKTHSRHSVSS